MNRLTDVHTTDALNNTINQFSYTLGLTGNRTSVIEHTGRVVDYAYDNLYRLTQEQVTDIDLGNRTTAYTYDAVGNRLTKNENGALTTYVYDDNDRLLTETGPVDTITYSYDDNGNTLTKSDALNTITYAYDVENRLITATEDTEDTTYSYDVDNIRQSKTDSNGTIQYVVDPNQSFAQVLEEQDENAQSIVSYVYGDDLISQNRSSIESFYHYDGLGSTRSLTDSIGIETDSYIYDAFGNLESQTGFTENNYLYTGEQYEPGLLLSPGQIHEPEQWSFSDHGQLCRQQPGSHHPA